MEKRYRALRIISTVYKVLGGLAALFTVLVIIGGCLTSVLGGSLLAGIMGGFDRGGGGGLLGGMLGGLIQGVLITFFALIYGGGISVTLFAFGEGLELLLALEENTRATAELLEPKSQS